MTDELPKLQLEKILYNDAVEIVEAREKARLIHHTRDIDAAGDEVEQAVRRVLRRKLPSSYYVGHGHIVDSQLVTSPQLDVVIADNSGAPILFMTENGTEYFPYESVYAVGEIKATYLKNKKPIHQFAETLDRIKIKLQRDKTPPNYIGAGVSLGAGLSLNIGKPYQNPLFSFMLFVDANEFQSSDIEDLYNSTPDNNLPNVICLLNVGIVVNTRIITTEAGQRSLGSINLLPEFNDPNVSNRWIFIPFGTNETRIGSNFGFLRAQRRVAPTNGCESRHGKSRKPCSLDGRG